MHTSSTHYKKLHARWSKRRSSLRKSVWEKHKDSLSWLKGRISQIAIGSAAGMLLLSAPPRAFALSLPLPKTLLAQDYTIPQFDDRMFLIADLSSRLPSEVQPLTDDQKQDVSAVLSDYFQLSVTPMVNGIRLNRNYGYIGKEQHLPLYPGDTISTHFTSIDESNLFQDSGMVPGLPAWHYFAQSKDSLTQEDILREKYYIAVQTFLAPGFNEHVSEYRDFFKYRKMLVVNPDNGKAIVCDIADAGPAEWTGKQLGGSPEVMTYLDRQDGAQRGPVLYFFIDDPNNQIPLGPVQIR